MDNNLNGALFDASQSLANGNAQGQMGGTVMPNETSGSIGVTASDILTSFSAKQKKDKEVSLSTLSQKEIKKIMKSVDSGWALAKKYYDDTVEPEVTKRTNIYNADEETYKKKFPYLSEQTKWRSRDVQTAAEWLLPGLVEAFVGGSKPVDIKGVNVDDDLKAKKIEQIISYQVERKNSLHAIMKFSIEEALRSNFGIAKLHWKHEEKREKFEFVMPNDDIETAYVLQEAETKGEIEITSVKPLDEAPDLLMVKYDKISVTANYPVIEFLSPYEVRFTPEASTFQTTKFVAHRKIVTGDYLKRKELDGTYENVDEAINKGGNITPTNMESSFHKDISNTRDSLSDEDIASKYVELKECYVNVDYNNDGIMEQLIVHCVEDVPIRISKNEYGFIPFYPCCVYYDPNKIFSDRSYEDLIEQQQDLKTAIVKQMIINIARQNVGQKIVDADVVDINALLDGDEIVMASNTDKPVGNYVYALETPQLSAYTMDLLNYCQSEIESQTGSTKYNQGLDSNSLNKTATGISMIMSAADKRAKMIARDIAENFYVPLIKGIIVLDQMYMRDEEIVRLNDENVAIRREELNIDYDLVINVGEGAGTKEARIQYLMILINQLIPLLVQSGIADDNTIYDSAKELLQEMGLRSSIASLTDPKSPEGIQKKQQAQQAQAEQVQMAQQMEAQKQQTELLKAVLPRVSIKYEDLPIAAQQQLLQAIGLGVDTSEFMAKTLLDGMNERQAGLPSNQDMQPEVEAKKPSESKSTNDKSKPGIKEGNTRAYYRKGNEK